MQASEDVRMYVYIYQCQRICCCLHLWCHTSCSLPPARVGSCSVRQQHQTVHVEAIRAYLKLGVDGGLHGLKPGDVSHSFALPGHQLVSGVLLQTKKVPKPRNVKMTSNKSAERREITLHPENTKSACKVEQRKRCIASHPKCIVW